MKLSIIIPVYNEEHTIDTLLLKVREVVLPSGLDKEIIVVNDGSSDRTPELLKKYLSDPSIKIFHLEKNSGKTAAVCKGIERATGDIVSIQDADLEYDPAEIPKLLLPIIQGQAPVVFGSRFKGQIKDMQPVNRLANIFSNLTFSLLYGVKLTDINTCHKAFKKEILRNIRITSSDFTFETEITAKVIRSGHRILEVPINYTARTSLDGKKINWPKALKMYWGIFRYRFA